MKRTRTHQTILGKISIPEFIILTNDPSFTAWGYAVLKGNRVLTTGCIKTEPQSKKLRIRKGDDTCRRTHEITRELLKTIHEHKVNYILAELPHGSQNARAAVMIGITIGILTGIASSLNIPIEWYSENDAKKTLLNRNSASKKEIINQIKTHYKVNWTGIQFRDEAVADALAIHFTACVHSNTLQFIQPNQ